MTLADLSAVGGFLSGLGIFITLAFALIEYGRTRREQLMMAAYEGELAWAEFNFETAKEPVLADLAVRSFQPGVRLEDFTAEEQVRLNFLFRSVFHRIEAQWFVSARRGLPPEIWAKRRMFARAYIDSPMGRALWERDKAMLNYTDAFIREIESAEATAALPA